MKQLLGVNGLALTAMLLLPACGDKRAVGAANVDQGLLITGSAQATTVAWNPIQSLLNVIFPTATALLPSSITDANGVSVNLGVAWVVMEEIELESETENADGSESEQEIEFKGPYYVDLLADNPSPIDSSAIAAQTYTKIKMKLHRMEDLEDGEVLPSDVPAGLTGQSIYLEASVGGRSFTYASQEETEFEVENKSGVSPDAASPLIVSVRLSELLAWIDLTGVSDGDAITSSNRIEVAGACPLIDESANDLYTCFRKGMQKSSRFGRDNDGDDDLDDNEEDESNDD